MSKIQNLTIPMFITNKDTPHIIAQANSGSGKSAAFVIGACVRACGCLCVVDGGWVGDHSSINRLN